MNSIDRKRSQFIHSDYALTHCFFSASWFISACWTAEFSHSSFEHFLQWFREISPFRSNWSAMFHISDLRTFWISFWWTFRIFLKMRIKWTNCTQNATHPARKLITLNERLLWCVLSSWYLCLPYLPYASDSPVGIDRLPYPLDRW